MRSVNSYQDIKTPEDLEEENTYESILQSLLEEYDPECGSYSAYVSNCRRQARNIMNREREKRQQEEDQERAND